MNINPKILVSKSEMLRNSVCGSPTASNNLHRTLSHEKQIGIFAYAINSNEKKIEEKKLSNDFVRVNAEKGVMNAYR